MTMLPYGIYCGRHSRIISGWEVCGEAVNGREAIEKASELNPDVIVLDLAMPIMNGLQAVPVLRRILPAVPIILVTLYANKFLEQEAFSAGVTVVVSKDGTVGTLVMAETFSFRRCRSLRNKVHFQPGSEQLW
jgi:CheY-like chemotaxis protein